MDRSQEEHIAVAGRATYSLLLATRPNDELDSEEVKSLLTQVRKSTHKQPNHVRYAMNGFVISVGAYVPELASIAIKAAETIGPVSIDMGENCMQGA